MFGNDNNSPFVHTSNSSISHRSNGKTSHSTTIGNVTSNHHSDRTVIHTFISFSK